MMSFLKKVEQVADRVVDKFEEGVQRTEDQIKGILEPNRRHNSPEEKMRDQIRKEINDSHRFKSFADERNENFIKWHVDGHDYFWALSEMLEGARECIFILDWWLTPELYLRRPPALHPEYRLDRILARKAQQGVKIHIIVYKEVTQTMSLDSHHTKKALEALHPNIAVMRHPDHIGAEDTVEFWSHHEKLVIVDNHWACVGGLDICFGRWDSHNHPLADVHPTDFSRTLFPGQDYNNSRMLDFQHVDNYVSNALSIMESPRMPWHDVHTTLVGPVVLDLSQHFIERWNEIKTRKYKKDDERFPYLAFPHRVDNAPNEAIIRHPHREMWHQMGRRFRERFHLTPEEEEAEEVDKEHYPPAPHGSARIQVVRSVSDWSHGVLTEHSIQNAYRQLIMEANHFIYIENQFFISNTVDSGPVKNLVAQSLLERIIKAAKAGEKFRVVVVIPEVPGFAGSVHDQGSIKTIMAAQYRTINRGGHSIYEGVHAAGFDPMDYIRFYHLRAYDRINAPYPSFVSKIEEKSGIKFHQAQVALARKIVGHVELGEKVPDTAFIQKPAASGGDGLTANQDKITTEAVPMPRTIEEASNVISRFEHGSDQLRGDDDVSDSIAQHMLHDKTGLKDEKWLGTEDEERDAYVSELLYIHSKLMIVDDRRVIIGSANLNDRSQKGDGDSEIALVVEDTDMIQTTMDGKPYMASRFAATFRRQLYREHLGLIKPQTCESKHDPTSFQRCAPTPNDYITGTTHDEAVSDPLADSTNALWCDTARKNREIYTEIFRPVPTNLVRDWNGYDAYVPKVKPGHVAPDVPLERVKDRLSQVRGSLVECPLDFLIDQKDFVEGPDWLGLNPTLPVYI